MAYGFTCLKCGQALTQDTVVFDLLNDDSEHGTNKLTLCLTEKELKRIWRKKGGAERYVVKLPWKDFLRYAGNEKNLGNGLLEKLQYSNCLEELRNQCRTLGMADEFVMQGLKRAFPIENTEERKKAPSFYREVKPVYQGRVLIKLQVFGNGCKENGDEVTRRCCRRECGSEQPDWAGRFEHRSVVLLGAEKKGGSSKTIREELIDYLIRYEHEEVSPIGEWIANRVDENENQIHATTVSIKGNEALVYLTLAAVPCKEGKYSAAEHFFQEADAYVLCDQVNEPNKENRQNDESEMLQCLQILQNRRSERLQLTDGHGGYAPVLLLFAGNKNNVDPKKNDEGNIIEFGDYFAEGLADAEESSICKIVCRNMERYGIDCYYFRMRYSTTEPQSSAEMAVAWILWTTGCLPIAMDNLLPDDNELPFYTVIPPICKQCRPDWQLKKRKSRTWEARTRMCRAEAAARLFLFGNAQENKEYVQAENPIEVLKVLYNRSRKKRDEYNDEK